MRDNCSAFIAGAAMAMLLTAASAAYPQAPAPATLSQIDAAFVCPESLPSDQAREAALRLFIDKVSAAQPTVTLEQLVDFRVALLKKRQCRATLENLGMAPASDDDGFNSPPRTARSGNFAVNLISTTDPDSLMQDWLKPTPGVAMASTTETVRNRPIVTFILFKGCRPDAAGNCNVTADFDTRDPSGKPYDQTRSAEVWVGHPPAPNYGLQLSVSGYGLRFEDKDALGPYRVHAAITDHVAGVTLQTEEVLTAVAK